MEESLSLFYTTIHSTWFANSSVILFLNKMDILAEKIQLSDLKTYFPGFNGSLEHIKLGVRQNYMCELLLDISDSLFHSFSFLCGLAPPSGKRRDIQDAMKFIKNVYIQKAVSYETKNSKIIYCHFTCATDTKNIRTVFTDVKDTVLAKTLEDFGMF